MYTDYSPAQSSPGVASKLLMDFNLNQFRKVDGQAAHVTCCGHLCDDRGKTYSALPFSRECLEHTSDRAFRLW